MSINSLFADKKLVLFDFDGPLLDSVQDGFSIIKEVAVFFKQEIPSDDFLSKHWGKNLKIIFGLCIKEYNWPENEIESYISYFYSISLKRDIYLVKGIENFLYKLKDNNFSLGIITNRISYTFERRTKILNFDLDLFSFIQTGDNYKVKKPDPRVFDQSLAFVKGRKESLLFIGDTVSSDWNAAKSANIDFLAVLSGACKKEKFIEDGLDEKFILNSTLEAEKFLF